MGVGDTNNRNFPTFVQLRPEIKVGMLSAGEDHTIAIKTGGIDITNAPSSSPLATSMPTVSGTFSPTLSGFDFYFWGSPQAVGQPLDTPDVSAPLDVGGGVVSSTAGSKYTVILLTDGSALSAGFIQSIDDYQGHLGLDRNLVVEGVNEFQPISSIFDKFNSDPNDPLTANGCGPPPVSFSIRPDDGERSLVNCSQFISIVPPSSTCCLPVTSLIDPVATTLIVEDSILN